MIAGAFALPIAGILAKLKRYSAAERWYRKALKYQPGNDIASASLGQLLHSNGRIEEAKEIFEDQWQQNPGNFMALRYYAYLSRDLDENEKVIQLCNEFVVAFPVRNYVLEEIWLLQGRAQENMGQFEAAIDSLRKVTHKRFFAHALLGLARCHKALGQEQEAISCCAKAVRPTESNLSLSLPLGVLLYELEQFKKAEEVFLRVLSAEPQNARALLYLGILNNKHFGKPELAKQMYLRALEADPNYCQAFHNLGVMDREARNYSDAIAWYTKAVDANPESPQSRWEKGLCFVESGDRENALKEYESLQWISMPYAQKLKEKIDAHSWEEGGD